MNKVKVKDFVNAVSNALELTEYNKNTLYELMCNIISKYEKIMPTIPANMDYASDSYLIKPVNGVFTCEDFLLNRLMRSVWDVEVITQDKIDNGFYSEGTKGCFDPSCHMISLNPVALERQLDRCKNILPKDKFDEVSEKALKKVVMHEFEHALQTRYNAELSFRNSYGYKKIFDEVLNMKQYKGTVRKYNELKNNFDSNEHYYSCGTHVGSKDIVQGNKYRDARGFDDLNEILNESESLSMVGQNPFIIQKFTDTGNYYNMLNPESSNCNITNYGILFKQIFGRKNSFELMYLNPIDGFKKFNEMYNDIFREIYQSDKDAIETFMNTIYDIKRTDSPDKHQKLSYALTKCLEKKIKLSENIKSISNDKILNTINCFETYTLSNLDQAKRDNLEHVKILNKLKEGLKNRHTNNEENNNLSYVPTFDELKNIILNYESYIGIDGNTYYKDRYTNEIVTDNNLIETIKFASLWLNSAVMMYEFNEPIKGFNSAFNDESKEIYDLLINMSKKALNDAKHINIIEIFVEAGKSQYSYAQDIISNILSKTNNIMFLEKFIKNRDIVENHKVL